MTWLDLHNITNALVDQHFSAKWFGAHVVRKDERNVWEERFTEFLQSLQDAKEAWEMKNDAEKILSAGPIRLEN